MDEQIYSLLKLFKKYDSISTIQLAKLLNVTYPDILNDIVYLFENEYIYQQPNPLITSPNIETQKGILEINGQLSIAAKGHIELNNYRKQHINFVLIEIRNWASFIIALAAFIKSFFF